MSDDEPDFESDELRSRSKADAGASKTFSQQAGTIRKNGHLVIKRRPCKVVDMSTSKTGEHEHANIHFVAIDIFTGEKLEDIVPFSHNCDVLKVTRIDYQLVNLDDGFLNLMDTSGEPKDDLPLPTNEELSTQIKDGFDVGKDLLVTVMSAMGEEHVVAVKEAPA